MQKPFISKQNNDLTDMSQGHKIAGALYLVTGHLTDTDPLKVKIRSCAVDLLASDTRVLAIEQLHQLLATALIAKLISQRNIMILDRELHSYARQSMTATPLEGLFSPSPELSGFLPKKTSIKDTFYPIKDMSVSKKDTQSVMEAKNKRQNQIIEFINVRKSAGIKDIAELFSDISEKTIQRELNTLVALGRITKRGDKRWSVYMAVPEKTL